jgi:hypothetical protein
MTTTLLLDDVMWDLVIDASSNIAMASDPYATSQDVCSACRLFKGELWYDTTQGVPYFTGILGQQPTLGFLSAKYSAAAQTVPNVVSAKAVITGLANRGLTGSIEYTTSSGSAQSVGF